jgi:hypothetical protein
LFEVVLRNKLRKSQKSVTNEETYKQSTTPQDSSLQTS